MACRPPKKKGNPIITRYPPPPGYRGPAQPQGPFGTVQYQTPQQGYPQAPSVPGPYANQSYQLQSFGAAQGYASQQPYSQPGYQWPQQASQSFSSHPPTTQPPHYTNPSPHPQQQNGHPHYPSQPPPINTNQPAWPNAQGWQQSAGSATYPPTNSFGASPANGQPTPDSNPYPTPLSANPKSTLPTPVSAQSQSATGETTPGEKPELFLGWDDWDFDFDGAIWPKANEPVDPDLSLGVITWRPAKQVTRALPATFEEAEEQSLKPPAEKLGNGESVSLYFTTENSYEAFLDVRKTDEWYDIKDDPVFVVFKDEEMKTNLISIENCLSLRDRPDEPIQDAAERQDEDMHDSTWSVMDHLEQALSGDMEDVKQLTPPHTVGKFSRDQAQEDILAKLGVTGSPKPPSGETVTVPLPRNDSLPASLPQKPPAPPSANIPKRPDLTSHRTHSYSGPSNTSHGFAMPRPYGSSSVGTPHQPPPGPPFNGRSNSWNDTSEAQTQGAGATVASSRGSPACSEASNGTVAGSEFSPRNSNQDYERHSTTIPALKRSESSFARKRSYGDTEHEDAHTRQHDDHSKRKRRSQVDTAYR